MQKQFKLAVVVVLLSLTFSCKELNLAGTNGGMKSAQLTKENQEQGARWAEETRYTKFEDIPGETYLSGKFKLEFVRKDDQSKTRRWVAYRFNLKRESDETMGNKTYRIYFQKYNKDLGEIRSFSLTNSTPEGDYEVTLNFVDSGSPFTNPDTGRTDEPMKLVHLFDAGIQRDLLSFSFPGGTVNHLQLDPAAAFSIRPSGADAFNIPAKVEKFTFFQTWNAQALSPGGDIEVRSKVRDSEDFATLEECQNALKKRKDKLSQRSFEQKAFSGNPVFILSAEPVTEVRGSPDWRGEGETRTRTVCQELRPLEQQFFDSKEECANAAREKLGPVLSFKYRGEDCSPKMRKLAFDEGLENQ